MRADMTDKSEIDYAKLIDEAMHYVVRRVLQETVINGLPGDHHFFISFRTNAEGVMISDALKNKYPEEMTIVIQHQFYDLEVEDDYFSIVLSFDHVKQNLTIPFAALTSFVDPSVRFGLQFNLNYLNKEETEKVKTEPASKELKDADGKIISNVITLDSFRKKNGNKDA